MVAENPELAAGPSTAATRRRRAPSAAVGTPRRSVGAVLAWAWIPLTAAYLLVLAWHLPAVIERASWNADNANMLNLSRELGDLGPGERVNMGNAPNYTTLWLNQGLYGLTGSGTLVEFAPLIWYAIAVALIVWSVAATAGRLAAGLTAGILICLSEVSLELVTSHAVHGATWFTVAALGALVVLVGRSRDVRPRACVAVALAAGILAGANAASDPLALPVAIVPAVIAIAALWLTAERRNRIAAPAAAFVVAVVVSMPVVGAIGTSRGIVADLPPGNLATVDQMWGSFLQSIDNAASFFGPAPLGAPVSGVGLLRLVVGLAGIAGVVATAAFGIRLARRWHAEPAARSVASPRDALRIYWAASLLVGGAAVLTSPLAFEVRESSVRYEFNLFLAAAVGLPLWLLGR